MVKAIVAVWEFVGMCVNSPIVSMLILCVSVIRTDFPSNITVYCSVLCGSDARIDVTNRFLSSGLIFYRV